MATVITTVTAQARLRGLPKIDELAQAAAVADGTGAGAAPRWALVEAARRAVEGRRREILAGADTGDTGREDGEDRAVAPARVAALARALAAPSLSRVINATGVILHTNLGRAPLGAAAIARVVEVARGYSNLEYDVGRGERGERHGHVRAALCALTGAEDAVAVNNCAAAVLLGLAALAGDGQRREVVVSRGELIEIGGAFRVPDVMRMSGATLVEVGTTNKTHLADYEGAIGERSALLLKVHRSNFAMLGFTADVEPAALVTLGRARGLPVMIDLGSGLLDATPVGLAAAVAPVGSGAQAEPTVGELVAAGVDLVAFSGDKLLGGPQAGLLVGRAAAVERARRHPLMRAIRPDKLALAALEATLAAHRDQRAVTELPALAMLSASPDEIRGRAEALLAAARAALGPRSPGAGRLSVVACDATVGGGCLPLAVIPSWAVAVSSQAGSRVPSADAVDAALRAAPVPVVGRIVDDRLLLDARTIAEAELGEVAAALRAAVG